MLTKNQKILGYFILVLIYFYLEQKFRELGSTSCIDGIF